MHLSARLAILKRTWLLGLACLAALLLAAPSRAQAPSDPIELLTSVIVLDLDSVNDADQSYEASVYLETIRATDPAAPGTWNPLIAIGNQQRAWAILPESVEVNPDGTMRLRRAIWGSFSQPLDLRRFPFDHQVFEVRLLAEAGSDDVVFVQHPDRPSGISDSLSVPDWNITSVTSEPGLWNISDGIDPVPMFTLRIEAERRSEYYVYTMILPLIVIVSMSFVSFWIDPMNFAAQIGVASTSMLTVITYRVAAVQVLPRTSYFTDMDVFIVGATLIVFLTLIVTVSTAMIFRAGREALARRMDRIARVVTPLLFIATIFGAFSG